MNRNISLFVDFSTHDGNFVGRRGSKTLPNRGVPLRALSNSVTGVLNRQLRLHVRVWYVYTYLKVCTRTCGSRRVGGHR